MNKKTLRIAGWALGLSMAVAGIGAAVGASSGSPIETKAATLGENLTAVSSLTSGNKYVIVGAGGKYALPTNPTVSKGKVTGTAIASVPSDADGYLWTFTKSGSYWLIGDGSKYIYHSNGGNSGTDLAYGTSQSTYPWSLTFSNSSWTFAGVNDSTVKTRGMLCNNGTFGGYALSNASNYGAMTIYEVAATAQTISGSSSAYVGNDVTLTTNATTAAWTITANTAGASLSAASGKSITVSATQAGSVTIQAVAAGYTTVTHTITFNAVPTDPYITPIKTSISEVYTGQNQVVAFTYGNLSGELDVSTSDANVTATIQNDDGEGNAEVKIDFASAGNSEVYLLDGSTKLATIAVEVTASSVSITGLASSDSVYIGKTLDLGSTIEVTKVGSFGTAVTWESDNKDVASVDANGVVTGLAEGTANITVASVSDPNVSMTCTVTVSEEPLQYVITFGSTKNTNPTEIKTDASFKSTWSFDGSSDVTVGDFSKIYGISTSQLKAGSGSASASISFTIPDTAYITSVTVVVATGNSADLQVKSGATGAQTESQSIAAGTLTFDDYLANEQSNYILLTSSASGAFYLSSITIGYEEKKPELAANVSSFDLAVTKSQDVTFTPTNFTPTGYEPSVLSGTSLTKDSVKFDGNVATITAGDATGTTVLRITGTNGNKSAFVDITVNVTEARNLLSLSIATASDATSFKVGQSFDVGSLAIRATFDNDPTEVVYSKANGNLGALTITPAIGYVFTESDIANGKTATISLEVGEGSYSAQYTYNVADKDYAAKVTDVAQLWDGQKVYFGDQEGTRVNIAHAGGNQLGSEEAVVSNSKGLSLDDVTNAVAYTVHRELIDSTTYYSFSYDGYYLEASSTSSNYLTRTNSISDMCRFEASIDNGAVSLNNKGNSSKPLLKWNSSSNWFSCYASNTTLDDAALYAVESYSESAVAADFAKGAMHMEDYDPDHLEENKELGSCSGENGYYANAKRVWNAMSEDERLAVSLDDAETYARLEAWAAANGDKINDSDMSLVAKANNVFRGTDATATGGNNGIICTAIIAATGIAAVAGFAFLRRKKEDR